MTDCKECARQERLLGADPHEEWVADAWSEALPHPHGAFDPGRVRLADRINEGFAVISVQYPQASDGWMAQFLSGWISEYILAAEINATKPLADTITEYLASDGSEGTYDAKRMISARNALYGLLGRPEDAEPTHEPFRP